MDTRRDNQRVAALAIRQQGRITRAQLNQVGVSNAMIHNRLERGHLTRVLPKVYAVGHAAPSREADLWAAVLYAGPGAMLSHGTAAHWRGLIDYAPRQIEVSTPRKIRSFAGVRVYGRRSGLARTRHNQLPVTTVPMMMLDLAAHHEPKIVMRALAQLDYRGQLDLDALRSICAAPGRSGGAGLRAALVSYFPELARANGRLEWDFLEWCRARGVPLPRPNVELYGITVDAYWPQQGLVVELDGDQGHRSKPQRRRDRSKELTLRSHGLRVVRYDWALIQSEPARVHADLMRELSVGGPLATNVATGVPAARRRR